MQVAELPRSVTDTKSPTTQYDAVIVSTSPVCLMTALALRAQGKRVLLVDQSAIVGGAWITTDLGGFSNVEVGCHLIDPDPAVYGFMKGLGIAMQPLSPRPEILSRGPARFPQRIPYSHRWLRDLYDIVARPEPSAFVTLPRTNAKDILKHVYRVFRHAFKAVKGDTRDILYPKGGCSEIVARLAELVELSGVEVRTSTRLTEVSMDRDAGVAYLRLNGELVTAGAYMPASVNLPHVADGAKLVPLDANKHIFQNLYLVLRDTGPINLTYTLLYGDKLVHRVSDLTRFAKRKRRGTKARSSWASRSMSIATRTRASPTTAWSASRSTASCPRAPRWSTTTSCRITSPGWTSASAAGCAASSTPWSTSSTASR